MVTHSAKEILQHRDLLSRLGDLLKKSNMSLTCDRLVVFSGYSGFLHQ